MWKKWKESEFFKKLKQTRVNRLIYLTALVVLLSLAVVLAVTTATNRAKKSEATLPQSNLPTIQRVPTASTQKTDPIPTVKDETVPEMASPVAAAGKLLKAHSVDTQVFSQTMQDWRVHLGIDILTEANAPVLAAADGSVKRIWQDPMMGWCIALSHKGDCVTVYKNLSAELAEGLAEGIPVKRGQLLGHVGDTAMLEIAEEPHLHMEMTVGGLQVDPMEYFSKSVIASLSGDPSIESGSTGK